MDRTVSPAHRERSEAMQLGMIGLGRMGASMVRRLLPAAHQCVVHDANSLVAESLAAEGAAAAAPSTTSWPS